MFLFIYLFFIRMSKFKRIFLEIDVFKTSEISRKRLNRFT